MDNKNNNNNPLFSYWLRPVVAAGLAGLTILASDAAPNFLPFGSSFSDYFIVTRANRIAKQHHSPLDVTLVMISENFINQLPYRSPVDRCVLAAGISSIMNLKPKVLGIDFVLDKRSEPHKDVLLRKVINAYQQKLVIAANITNHTTRNPKKTETLFASEKIHASALLLKSADYVVRNATLNDQNVPTFAAQLTTIYRQRPMNTSYETEFLIDWLGRDSGRGEAFSIIPLELFLDTAINQKCSVELDLPTKTVRELLRPGIENKLVILGADLEKEDRHITPFDSVWQDEVALSGAEIHANIAQQLIDERHIGNIHWLGTFLILCATYFLSIKPTDKPTHSDTRPSKNVKWIRYRNLIGTVLLRILPLILAVVYWIGLYLFGYILPTGLIEFSISAYIVLAILHGPIGKLLSKAD